MRYHIMHSSKLVLPNGERVSFEDVSLHEPTHEYDIGTREKLGLKKRADNDNDYLEDFMEDAFVVILEAGDIYKGEERKHNR
jgi:hypothetical protein